MEINRNIDRNISNMLLTFNFLPIPPIIISRNQLIPPAGCTPPTAADLLKSKGNHSIGEVDACNPVEFATTIVSEKKEEET